MTAADIQRLFPSAKAGPCTPHQKNCGTRIEVPGIDVAGVKCSVILTLDKSGKLDLVLLAPAAPTRKNADALLSGLTEKYGRPTSREQNVWTWTFTTTTISLSAIISGDFGMVFLSYQRRASLQPNL